MSPGNCEFLKTRFLYLLMQPSHVQRQQQALLMAEVTSLSIGVRVAGDLTEFVLPRGTLPCKRSVKLMTLLDNQKSATIEIREGTRTPTCHNEHVMRMSFPLNAHAHKRYHVLELTLEIDASECLVVRVYDVITKVKAVQQLRKEARRRYTHAHVETMVNEGEEYEEIDARQAAQVRAEQVRWAEEYNRKLHGM